MKRAITLHDGETIEGELVESLGCDFNAKTWTFLFTEDAQIGGGEYIVISCYDLQQLALKRFPPVDPS